MPHAGLYIIRVICRYLGTRFHPVGRPQENCLTPRSKPDKVCQ